MASPRRTVSFPQSLLFRFADHRFSALCYDSLIKRRPPGTTTATRVRNANDVLVDEQPTTAPLPLTTLLYKRKEKKSRMGVSSCPVASGIVNPRIVSLSLVTAYNDRRKLSTSLHALAPAEEKN